MRRQFVWLVGLVLLMGCPSEPAETIPAPTIDQEMIAEMVANKIGDRVEHEVTEKMVPMVKKVIREVLASVEVPEDKKEPTEEPTPVYEWPFSEYQDPVSFDQARADLKKVLSLHGKLHHAGQLVSQMLGDFDKLLEGQQEKDYSLSHKMAINSLTFDQEHLNEYATELRKFVPLLNHPLTRRYHLKQMSDKLDYFNKQADEALEEVANARQQTQASWMQFQLREQVAKELEKARVRNYRGEARNFGNPWISYDHQTPASPEKLVEATKLQALHFGHLCALQKLLQDVEDSNSYTARSKHWLQAEFNKEYAALRLSYDSLPSNIRAFLKHAIPTADAWLGAMKRGNRYFMFGSLTRDLSIEERKVREYARDLQEYLEHLEALREKCVVLEDIPSYCKSVVRAQTLERQAIEIAETSRAHAKKAAQDSDGTIKTLQLLENLSREARLATEDAESEKAKAKDALAEKAEIWSRALKLSIREELLKDLEDKAIKEANDEIAKEDLEKEKEEG